MHGAGTGTSNKVTIVLRFVEPIRTPQRPALNRHRNLNPVQCSRLSARSGLRHCLEIQRWPAKLSAENSRSRTTSRRFCARSRSRCISSSMKKRLGFEFFFISRGRKSHRTLSNSCRPGDVSENGKAVATHDIATAVQPSPGRFPKQPRDSLRGGKVMQENSGNFMPRKLRF
jgi:hypothetical protein